MLKQARPLADLLGQPVQFQGYMESWKDVPDRHQVKYLFHPVTVKPYGAGVESDRHITHLWFYFPKDRDAVEDPKLKHKFSGVGTVCRYIRSDGSFDYGIDCTKCLDTDLCIRLFNRRHDHPDQQVELLQKVLGAIDQKRCFFPYEFNQAQIDAFAKETQGHLKTAQHNAEAKERNDAVSFVYKLDRGFQRAQRFKLKPDPVQFGRQGRSGRVKGFG